MLNIQVYCNRCGSERLRMEYKIVNRNTRYSYRELVCFDCSFPSQLKDYFDSNGCQNEYYISHKQRCNISDSYEQFTNKAINYIKDQIAETFLKDQNGNILKVWDGCVDQEVYQFLRW